MIKLQPLRNHYDIVMKWLKTHLNDSRQDLMKYIDKWCHQKCYVMIMKSMKDNEIVTLWPKTHKNDQIQHVLAHIGNKRYRNYAARCDSSRLIMSSKLLRYNKAMIKF